MDTRGLLVAAAAILLVVVGISALIERQRIAADDRKNAALAIRSQESLGSYPVPLISAPATSAVADIAPDDSGEGAHA
jgi:hypothetical protein